MGLWTAIATPGVDETQIRTVLQERNISWEAAGHITATASLARAIRETKVPGVPIATLVDLIVWPGVPNIGLTVDGFPGPDILGRNGKETYDLQLRSWQMLASGRRLRLGIQFDESLRRFARQEEESRLIRLLVRSKREFARTVQSLISAGVRPQDLSSDDDLGKAAIKAWTWLEGDLPAITAPREDLWMDFHEFKNQSTPRARQLRDRVEQALEQVFGANRGRRVLVHHGFYFFTPPQWALFQLLRAIPDIDQLFIVHDDGSNPAFETWRRFFVDKWDMPRPKGTVSSTETSGIQEGQPAAVALRKALVGESVAVEGLADDLTVLECRSPAELVRQWRLEKVGADGQQPRWYAADSKSVERYMRRLGRESEGSIDLAQLPIGSFLLAIHDCIRPLPTGRAEVALEGEAIVDIASSGYLEADSSGPKSTAYVSALRRALPFFNGCVTGEEWQTRAHHLLRLTIAEIEPLGAKDLSDTDLKRMRKAAENPLRLVPWADLSQDEASGVLNIISSTVKLVERIAARERIVLKDHVQFLKDSLKSGMAALREEERQIIASKVQGFSIGLDEEIDVEGIVDIVAMLLGRTAEFDAFGDVVAAQTTVNDLRGLDALGLRKSSRNLHLTNLTEGTFPTAPRIVGWPFQMEDMTDDRSHVDTVTVEILKARADNASLSDLYLLWLALDGVEEGARVTLSWVSELDGERRSPSSLISLLTRPSTQDSPISQRAGGVTVEHVESANGLSVSSAPPMPANSTVSMKDLADAVAGIDPRAAASGLACARRFALQWLLGESHAFRSEHHQSMLYGNVLGALMRGNGFTRERAEQVADDLWRHLTPGQRQSSLSKRRVKGGGLSADSVWTLTLTGSKAGAGPHDRAYKAAIASSNPDVDAVAPEDAMYLPAGINNYEVCRHCPVRSTCAASEMEETH
ncbi:MULTISPECIES: hypothetical protein [Paenarthrobacter]|uniref:hypothetical protein n=1 Tax=Paenarthrobacter TaxID=1742992 RepID=UPI00074D4159|nr:hypothetical protein [Paenarthrobacter ureafaciens]AMB39661.1 hypothetical protein AUT26_05115 [Arthrobacter sp. ATCC 21022]KUR65341.1 hypothetical protein JM67_05715 [Arthrobacter sp. ATCC 21022]RWW95892.1 hypothetical protein AUR_15640 [Paenarthrobacter ureafaciens]